MKTNGMSDPQKIVIDFASGAISPDFFCGHLHEKFGYFQVDSINRSG